MAPDDRSHSLCDDRADFMKARKRKTPQAAGITEARHLRDTSQLRHCCVAATSRQLEITWLGRQREVVDAHGCSDHSTSADCEVGSEVILR